MSYGKALNGYTRKEIFTTKLNGEPFDVLRDEMVKKIEWLVDNKIFSLGTGTHYCSYRYTCLYPIRIWYYEGKAPYARINREWLEPGDIWTF